MIYLLTLLFTIGLAPVVGAEPFPLADSSGNLRITLSLSPSEEELGAAIVSAASQRDPCLTQMKAAMKAMEPHLGKGLTMFWITPEEGKRHDENMRIKQQWDDAAKACWREK